MTCATVRVTLMEGALADADPRHLSSCAECRALADRLRGAEDAIGAAVDAFAEGGDFDAAFARAAAPPVGRRRGLEAVGLVFAAAAAIVLVVAPALDQAEPLPERAPVATSPAQDPGPAPSADGVPPVPPVPPPTAPDPSNPPAAPLAAPPEPPAPGLPAQEPVPVPAVAAPPPVPGRALSTCGSVPDLEPRATLGRLTAAERACLDEVATAGPEADRTRAGALLVVDAWSGGDRTRWAALAARQYAASPEADLAYQLALFSQMAGASDEALRWSALALAGSEVWTGATRDTRVARLHKVRAHTTLLRARDARTACLSEPRACPDADRALADARASVLAWLDAARAAETDVREATGLCRSLLGKDDPRCEG